MSFLSSLCLLVLTIPLSLHGELIQRHVTTFDKELQHAEMYYPSHGRYSDMMSQASRACFQQFEASMPADYRHVHTKQRLWLNKNTQSSKCITPTCTLTKRRAVLFVCRRTSDRIPCLASLQNSDQDQQMFQESEDKTQTSLLALEQTGEKLIADGRILMGVEQPDAREIQEAVTLLEDMYKSIQKQLSALQQSGGEDTASKETVLKLSTLARRVDDAIDDLRKLSYNTPTWPVIMPSFSMSKRRIKLASKGNASHDQAHSQIPKQTGSSALSGLPPQTGPRDEIPPQPKIQASSAEQTKNRILSEDTDAVKGNASNQAADVEEPVIGYAQIGLVRNITDRSEKCVAVSTGN
jgi:hypothetical protein